MAGRARPGEQVVPGVSAIFLHGSIHIAAPHPQPGSSPSRPNLPRSPQGFFLESPPPLPPQSWDHGPQALTFGLWVILTSSSMSSLRAVG